jgi:hypothetical protein
MLIDRKPLGDHQTSIQLSSFFATRLKVKILIAVPISCGMI